MKIEITEEMREAVRLYRRRHEKHIKRQGSDDAQLRLSEATLARLVAEAVDAAEKDTTAECPLGVREGGRDA